MKDLTPKQMAINIALFCIFVIAANYIVYLRVGGINAFVVMLALAIAAAITIFLVVYRSFTSFIFKKINPIYKTIHNINLPERKLKQEIGERDITNQVEREVLEWAKDRSKEIAQLKQLEKYRKEFLGNVSHELKTPIFNIQGYILTLLDGGLSDPNINQKYLERTEKSINRMISIVEDLESISRLESGELDLNYTKFNMLELFREVFELQEMMAKERKISLKFDMKYDTPVMVYADRDRIFEVVNNLVVNSIKYGKDGGKTIVSFMEMGENYLVDVSDNGIGIAAQNLNRIFERFYRTDKSRSRDMGGTGLGLAIVKHIIEAHNQTINVRSTFGAGSSFAFTIRKA
jgi:two-component system phosphate regulon sensor histidine kinase PhoR